MAYGVEVERRILALDITAFYHCTLPYCTNPSHTNGLGALYYTLISILIVSACHTLPFRPGSTNRKRVGLNVIPGWNTHVRPHYVAATNALLLWVANGRPLGGGLDSERRILHSRFRSALRWCKKNMESLRTSALSSSLVHLISVIFGGGHKLGRLVLEPLNDYSSLNWKRWCIYKTCQFIVSYESPV